jgi:hypothetical protein
MPADLMLAHAIIFAGFEGMEFDYRARTFRSKKL